MPNYTGRDAAYYQNLHDTAKPYQNNNWLVDELGSILSFKAKSLLELGCGNGRFLAVAAKHFDCVIGYDWARSPELAALSDLQNVQFIQCDITKTPFESERADIVVSADFLEHLSPDDLLPTLRKIDMLASQGFHKIACYDDGNCHLSVFNPEEWLQLFKSVNPAYVMERVEQRLGNANKVLVVITKGRPFHLLSPLKLNYGCGDVRLPGYIGVDIRSEAKGAQVYAQAWEPGPFQPGSVDEIYTRHMLEHLLPSDAACTLRNWFVLLRSGGILHIVVPDLIFHARQLLNQAKNWTDDPKHNFDHAMAGFYGWHRTDRGGSREDAHRWGYTQQTLTRYLEDAGFKKVCRVTEGEDSEQWHLNVTACK